MIQNKKQILDSRGNPIRSSGLYEGTSPYKKVQRSMYVGSRFTNDFHVNVSSGDWNVGLSRARDLFANMAPIASAIRELARLTVGDAWAMKYVGKDNAKNNNWWDKEAIPFSKNWMENGNALGGFYTLQLSLLLIIISVMRDGDVLVVLTEDEFGYPQYQLLPAHRIGGDKILSGKYKSFTCINGVIVDNIGKAIAYNIKGADPKDDVQISTRDAMLIYDPNYVEGRRGIPAITAATPLWESYKELIESELRSSKALSNYALQMIMPEEQIKDFQDGESSRYPFAQTETTTGADGAEQKLYVEPSQLGGEILLFRPEDGAEIKPIEFTRPSTSLTGFLLDHILRNCFASLDVPCEFAFRLDSGGATVRNLSAKIVEKVNQLQCMIIRPVWYRLLKYSLAKGMKNGYISYNDQWMNFEPTFPKEYSVDNGRDVKADIELWKIGVYTGEILAGKYGYDYYDNIKAKIAEGEYIINESKPKGVDPTFVVQSTPNANNTVNDQSGNSVDQTTQPTN